MLCRCSQSSAGRHVCPFAQFQLVPCQGHQRDWSATCAKWVAFCKTERHISSSERSLRACRKQSGPGQSSGDLCLLLCWGKAACTRRWPPQTCLPSCHLPLVPFKACTALIFEVAFYRQKINLHRRTVHLGAMSRRYICTGDSNLEKVHGKTLAHLCSVRASKRDAATFCCVHFMLQPRN